MKLKHFVVAAVAAPALLTSCMDTSWDLSNIDMTVGTKNDLTLPTSSTGDIVLKNIMNLKEDGVVKTITVDGKEMYVVSETGSANIQPVKVDPIKINRPTLESFEASIDRSVFFGSQKRSKKKAGDKVTYALDLSKLHPFLGTVNIETDAQTFHYTIKKGDKEGEKDDKAYYEIKNAKTSDITKDLVNLTSVKINDTQIEITLNSKANPIQFVNADVIHDLHFDEFVLTLPEGLNVKEASFTYNGSKHNAELKDGKVIFTKANSEAISIDHDVRIMLTLDGASIVSAEKDGIHFKYNEKTGGEVEMTGKFRVDGTFRIETEDFHQHIQDRLDALTSTELCKLLGISKPEDVLALNTNDINIDYTNSVLRIVPTQIKFKGQAVFDNDIEISSISGKLRHDVGSIDPIKLDDMPEFLDDPDVILDLENPLLFVKANNGLPAPAKTALKMSATTDGETVVRQTPELTAQVGQNIYMIADHNTDARPAEYKNATYVEVKDFGGIIRRIPKQVEIDVMPVELDVVDFGVPGQYPVDVDYEVYAPLTFGPSFQLVYQDTETDFDLGDDFDDIDAGYIEVKAKASNSLPAAMTLTVEPLGHVDAQNQKHYDTDLETVKLEIPAGATDYEVSFAIKAKNGKKLADALSSRAGNRQLDGIRYKAVIDKAVAGQSLSPKATVRLYDAQITVKGGVTYND